VETALDDYARRHRRLYRRRAWVNTLMRWLLVEPWRTVRVMRQVPLPRPVVSLLTRRVLTA
jgi:hypothetical protein